MHLLLQPDMTQRLRVGAITSLAIWCVLRIEGAGVTNRTSSAHERLSELKRLQNLLRSPDYDKEIRPNSWLGIPTIVDINLYVISLGPVDQVNMEYTIDMFYRQRWTEPRLSHNVSGHLSINYNMLPYLWVPDTYMINEKAAVFHEMTVPNVALFVFPDGYMLYSQRVTLKLSCDMKLGKFPMDNQTCPIHIQSYGHTTKDIILRWYWKEKIASKSDLTLSEFSFNEWLIGDETVTYTTGTYSCAYCEFFLDRQFNYYIIQTYIPTILIVILSWVSFWIDETAVPARVTLGILTVLTMTSQSTVVNQRLPRVSYIKAIDVWMSSCLMFVFAALIEFSVVNVITRESILVEKAEELRQEILEDNEEAQRVKLANARTSAVQDVNMTVDSSADFPRHRASFIVEQPLIDLSIVDLATVETYRGVRAACCRRINLCNQHRAAIVDVVSRVLFPAVFAFFNIVYWSIYLQT